MTLSTLALLPLLLGAEAAGAPQLPPEIQQMLDRELSEPLALKPFAAPGGLAGKVEAAAEIGIGTVEEGRVPLSVPLGTGQPLLCTVIPDRIDVGATLFGITQAAAQKVQLASVRTQAVLLVQSSPLLLFDVIYALESEKGKMLGQLKIGLMPHHTHSLVCQHDEPGYGKTFRRVVTGLAASLESPRPDPRAKSRFGDLHVMQVEQLPVGYEERVELEGEKGRRITMAYSTMVMPRSPVEFVAMDSYREEESDAEGLLLGGAYAQVVNGEVETQVNLTRDRKTGQFAYQGKKGGKEIAGRFAARGGLATELWFAKRFDRARGFGPKGPVKHAAYLFNADPTGPMPMTYRKDPARPRGIELTVGPMRMAGELDDAGLVSALETPVGPATMRTRRIWSRGAP